jgi:hypothetical protein
MIAQVAAHNTKNRMVHRGEGGRVVRRSQVNVRNALFVSYMRVMQQSNHKYK